MPLLSRRNYRRELGAVFFLPFLLVAVEGAVISVLVKNAYEGVVPAVRLNFIVAALAAAPALANISSFMWVRMSHGRHKVRFITLLQLALCLCVLLVAIAPRTENGLYLLLVAVLGARLCWAGFITIRSTVWRLNYARNARARATGKFATVQVLLVALLGIGLGKAMDLNEDSFRVLLPVGVGLGLIGIYLWSRVRVRQLRVLVRDELSGEGPGTPSFNPVSLLSVLRADKLYSKFMFNQFVLGLGNIMMMAPLVIVLRDNYGLGYLQGMLITNSIPLLMMPLAIPFWSRFLDRVHIIQFRSVHSWFFVTSMAVVLIATTSGNIWLCYFSAVVHGMAYGGGVLAWNLGHLDFAPPSKASQYMGVHVTLTGVRGLIAPFLGVCIYGLLERAWAGAGPWVFAVSLTFCTMGAIGYARMGRAMGRQGIVRTEPVEVTPPARAGQ